MIDRDSVRSNAKYLRNVRPVDPDEIAEYVEGHPHPGVVRTVLREEAFDLGLVEREDGTFVPVPEEPVSPPNWRPEAFPDAYAFAVEDLLVGRHGANWHLGESGDALREAVRRLKTDYLYGNDVEYDETAALGYALYHLPDYYATTGYVLDDLAENGLLPRKLRVLDVGAGVGSPALGLHDYLPEDSLVDYHAVEPSAAADVLDRLVEETTRNFHTTVHRTTAEELDLDELVGGEGGDAASADDGGADTDAAAFDLVLFGNVLSELGDPVAVVERYLDVLASDGSLVAIAPADLETSTGLREVERAVAPVGGDVTVYSPTLRLWDGETPSDRGWSFDVRDDLAVPGFQRRLDEGAGMAGQDAGSDADHEPGEFVNVDVQFSYSILRLDGARRLDVRASPERHAKMAEMERHVTERIDLAAVKLSHDLAARRRESGGNRGDRDDDPNPLFKISDGSESVEHYAVLTRESALNRDLLEAPYGAVLAFENVLCLWNDDEEAYNLVVDGETVVDLVAV
ncbi:small ribosomal subunit Rsm22 family protein [Halobium salinum]|uniref:Small ribosomal subunit Rsm22 family protein n=1 Tax=Halobium salinum TaxID=1364940 RepID=A0ABD5P7H7_9EURY|nr:methyltransferase [Halobium salinum]